MERIKKEARLWGTELQSWNVAIPINPCILYILSFLKERRLDEKRVQTS